MGTQRTTTIPMDKRRHGHSNKRGDYMTCHVTRLRQEIVCVGPR
jgi:hypothetical protein